MHFSQFRAARAHLITWQLRSHRRSTQQSNCPGLRFERCFEARGQLQLARQFVQVSALHESLEPLRAPWHVFRIMVIESSQPIAPGVDTPADLDKVRALLAV